MIWKERKWLVAGLGLLLLVNVVFFITYRVRYENRIKSLDGDLEVARQELRTVTQKREEAERLLGSVDETREDLLQVYDQWWSTRPERLAPMIVELQSLAEKSGLNPPSRNYGWSETSGEGGANTQGVGAESLVVSFRVEGTYEQIRNLINLIELSPHFVIIEEIGLANAADAGRTLSMTLKLKTLFRAEERTEQPTA